VNRGIQKPPLACYLTETPRAAVEYSLHLAAWPLRVTLPRGDGHPVLVLPGLMASDVSTRALRGALRAAGYRVHGWRLGRNIGPTARAMTGMRERLDDLNQRYGRQVSVIGWSLGGIFARELARGAPTAVRQVVTLGSPFRLAHGSQTRAHRLFNRFSHLHVGRWELPLEHGHGPLPVPTTSIYSRHDGIVAWPACLNDASPLAENIAVVSSHLGLGHHPAVIWAVADRLAQPPDGWRPFRAPVLLRHAFPRPDRYLDMPDGKAAA
jgi:pimeloyl-ACP methyl ester carboxylesterase